MLVCEKETIKCAEYPLAKTIVNILHVHGLKRNRYSFVVFCLFELQPFIVNVGTVYIEI